MPFSNIQRNLDITRSQGTSKIRSLLQGFVTSRFFFVLYFTITGVQKIVRYTENFVIGEVRYIKVRYVGVRYTEDFVISRFVKWRTSLYRGSLYRGLRYIKRERGTSFSLGYIEVRYTEDSVISRFLCTECCVKMAASKVKTRSSNLAEESLLSFPKQMDGYIKNSSV